MESVRVDVKNGKLGAFEALLKALSSTTGVETLTVKNCAAASVWALTEALRRNPSVLASISALDLSADFSYPFNDQWQIGCGGAGELRRLLPQLKNLTRLDLQSMSACLPSIRAMAARVAENSLTLCTIFPFDFSCLRRSIFHLIFERI
jgi:hypothetical protein